MTRHTHGLKEAIGRWQEYYNLGADIIFIEAPKNINEMKIICDQVPGKKVLNLLEGGLTPNLSLDEVEEIGFNITFHPLTLLAASMLAMKNVLQLLKDDKSINERLLDFNELKETIGFNEYYKISSQYYSINMDKKL